MPNLAPLPVLATAISGGLGRVGHMGEQRSSRPARKVVEGTRGLVRAVVYLHEDEAAALRSYAERRKLSESEVTRRALRRFLRIAD